MAVRSTKGKKHKTKPLRCKAPKKRTTIGKGRKRKVVCRTPPRKKAPAKATTPPASHVPAPPAVSPATPMPEPPAVVVPPAPVTPPDAPLPPIAQGFTKQHAERLLWRAGFGPRPGEAEQLAAMGLDAAVRSLVHPEGEAQLVGPAPVDDDGNALAPQDIWGHGHLWWLDRMVRSTQPLVERMTLVWHDWFACSQEKVQTNLMLGQNALFRRHALGSFRDLLHDVTVDPAMLDFLDGIRSNRWSPNENYAREVMELFTLGAGRGAYTESDIRNAARALTGWRASWTDGVGLHTFRYDATWHDTGTKTIFGTTGNFGVGDVLDLCLAHPQHASWFVTRLWSQFVPEPPDDATRQGLEALYLSSGRQVRPVLEAILKHPRLYDGPAMVVPPVVQNAGLLRALGRGVDTESWVWLGGMAGQVLFAPPDVSGWDEARWLSTSTWTGRWYVAAYALRPTHADPWNGGPYDAAETPATAVARAHQHLGSPSLTPETWAELQRFAETALPSPLAAWQQSPYRAMRQNALRMLIATSADLQAR